MKVVLAVLVMASCASEQAPTTTVGGMFSRAGPRLGELTSGSLARLAALNAANDTVIAKLGR